MGYRLGILVSQDGRNLESGGGRCIDTAAAGALYQGLPHLIDQYLMPVLISIGFLTDN